MHFFESQSCKRHLLCDKTNVRHSNNGTYKQLSGARLYILRQNFYMLCSSQNIYFISKSSLNQIDLILKRNVNWLLGCCFRGLIRLTASPVNRRNSAPRIVTSFLQLPLRWGSCRTRARRHTRNQSNLNLRAQLGYNIISFNFWCVEHAPVSYTHLDVYKRQQASTQNFS